MTELLPCPFCGYKTELKQRSAGKQRKAYCTNYGVCAASSIGIPVEEWNTRSTPLVDVDKLAEETAQQIEEYKEWPSVNGWNKTKNIKLIKAALEKAKGRG